ncbi:hypothetical protein HK57_00215 [Aspergillus ustus]|uniref:Uncharacterized protein n=1 Tax=Aspergillus ustus TaxID=40382 RepID=A0A0C1BUU7_ASPUT|nr:hypothetical protein HK57_00215 [Aspergillus ustus]
MPLTDSDTGAGAVGGLRVQAAAVVTATAGAGAMLSLSAISIPVVLDTNSTPAHMVTQWIRIYHYGLIILPATCIATCMLYVYLAFSKRYVTNTSTNTPNHKDKHKHKTSHSHSRTYALAGVSTLAMVPFTWGVMAPTNNMLFALGEDGVELDELGLGAVRALVVRWSLLHVARSLFPLVGAIVGVMGLVRETLSDGQ